MNDKAVWIGFGSGIVAASCIFNIAILNNNYSDSLPKSMFLSTSAVVPIYINLQHVTLGLFTIGILIVTAFLISNYTSLNEEL